MDLIKNLLEKKFVTEEEMTMIEESTEVVNIENCGNSGQYIGKTWYNVTLVDNAEYSIYQ